MNSYRRRAGKRPSARQDAPGRPITADQWLQDALAQAGATVSLETVTSWTDAQHDDAWRWARAQVEANANAKPGHSISVRWPDHVSAAHLDGMKPYAVIDMPPPEPEEVRALMKRPRKKAQIARVKQAADRKTRRQRG